MFHFRPKMLHVTFLGEDETFLQTELTVCLILFSKSFFTFFTCDNQIYT